MGITMKSLIVTLLLSTCCFAQQSRTFTPEMRKYNFEKIQLGRAYKFRYQECRELFNEQQTRMEALADSIAARNARNRELESINAGLLEEAHKLSYDLGKLEERGKWYNSKWLYYGLGLITGGVLVNEIKD